MSDSQGPIDASFVRDLAEIMKANDLARIEIKSEELKLTLSTGAAHLPSGPGGGGAMVAMPSFPSPAGAAPAAAAPATQGGGEIKAAADSAAAGSAGSVGDTIASPMVGTAYLAPSPGAPDFVKEGDLVKEGDTLLIIEAMKVMNQIPAPRSGKIMQIMCENGQPVEFDQPLMVIE